MTGSCAAWRSWKQAVARSMPRPAQPDDAASAGMALQQV